MHRLSKSTLHGARRTSLIAVTMVSAGLILSATALQAKDKTSTDDGWGEWKSMGNGYVARRRQPAKLYLPKAERRQANVQPRTKKSKGVKGKQVNLPEQAAIQVSSAGKGIVTVNGKKDKKDKSKPGEAWIYTAEEGLYSVLLTDLAASLGVSKKDLKKLANKGELTITTAEALTEHITTATPPRPHHRRQTAAV